MKFAITYSPYRIKLSIKIWYFWFVWMRIETCRVTLFTKYGILYYSRGGIIGIGFDWFNWSMNKALKKMNPNQLSQFKNILSELSNDLK